MGCYDLGETDEDAGGLGEAGGVKTDAVLDFDGEGIGGGLLVQLFCCCQRIGKVRHGSELGELLLI